MVRFFGRILVFITWNGISLPRGFGGLPSICRPIGETRRSISCCQDILADLPLSTNSSMASIISAPLWNLVPIVLYFSTSSSSIWSRGFPRFSGYILCGHLLSQRIRFRRFSIEKRYGSWALSTPYFPTKSSFRITQAITSKSISAIREVIFV